MRTVATGLAATIAVSAMGLAVSVGDAHQVTRPDSGQHAGQAAPQAAAAFDEERAFQASQQAIGRSVGDHALVDADGRTVKLGELLDRPAVVSMIYTSCHHICPTLTTHLKKVVETARSALGEEAFRVLTVGFDTDYDTPRAMAMFAADRGIDSPHWRFLSGDATTIEALAAETGFSYRRSPQGFDHITQTTLVDTGGVVRHQVYGTAFDPPLLVEPLKRILRGEAVEQNSLKGWWRGIRLLCTVYDPNSGRYHFDYSLVVAFVMGLSALSFLAVFIYRSWRSTRRVLKPDLDQASHPS